MSYLPQNTSLGQLEILEVYEFYDRPLLFACCNRANTYYLVVLVQEVDEADVWLYVATSPKRLQHIRSGGIDLHDAFAETEDGISYIVTQPHNEVQSKIEVVSSGDINPAWLPYPQEYLNLPTETLPELDSVERRAVQTQRIHTKLHLTFRDMMRTEAPVEALGQALVNFQKLVRATGDYVLGREGSRGKTPEPIALATELSLVGAGSGSFEVVLAEVEKTPQPNLPGLSILEAALVEVTNLIKDTGDPSQFSERIKDYQPRLTSRYLDLLKVLRRHVTETTISWASPDQEQHGTAELKPLAIESAISYLEDVEKVDHDIVIVTGEFIGGNSRTQRFEIATEAERFVGTVEGIDPDKYNPTIGSKYEARIRKIIKQRAASEEPTVDYELLKLRLIE